MTRGLDWKPSYQKMEDIYPYMAYEGIRSMTGTKWEDPFRLTMDAYWKYQAEKERKLYAIIDAFNQNNGHLNVTDARYLNTVKLFISGISPLEYVAHRGFSHVGRQFPGPGPRVACLMRARTRSATPRPDPLDLELQQVLQRDARLPPRP